MMLLEACEASWFEFEIPQVELDPLAALSNQHLS